MATYVDTLQPGQNLLVGDILLSSGKALALELLPSTLVLYDERTAGVPKVLWSIGSLGVLSKLAMQGDGNLVLYDTKGNLSWASNTWGANGPVVLRAQDDGNLVLYGGGQTDESHALWDSGTYQFKQGVGRVIGHEDAFIEWVDNAVATAGHAVGSTLNDITDAVGKVGDEIASIDIVGPYLHVIFTAVVGPATEPFQITAAVILGEPLDQVALDALNRELKAFKEVGPYVQMVMSFVPGIGQGISAAMGVALALANGQPIDKALIAGVEGALPGGPLAKMAFDIAANVADSLITGKKINANSMIAAGVSAVVDATGVQIPQAAVDGITVVLQTGASVMQGQSPDQAMLSHANGFLKTGTDTVSEIAGERSGERRKGSTQATHYSAGSANTLHPNLRTMPSRMGSELLVGNLTSLRITPAQAAAAQAQAAAAATGRPAPPTGYNYSATSRLQPPPAATIGHDDLVGIQIALAFHHARVLQSVSTNQLQSSVLLSRLTGDGYSIMQSDPTALAASQPFTSSKQGFAIGLALERQYQGSNHGFVDIRNALSDNDKKGFDAAACLHIAAVTTPKKNTATFPLPAGAAYLITRGMREAPPANKAALMTSIAAVPAARPGAVIATVQILQQRESFWHSLLRFFHLVPPLTPDLSNPQ